MTPPLRFVRFDPAVNRTGRYWHTFVPNVAPGQLYGFRVDGRRAGKRHAVRP